MVTKTIDVIEAQNQLNELLTLALQGAEIILARDDMPLARLVPVGNLASTPRVAGLNQGSIVMSEDFDEPLPENFWLGTE